MTVRKRGESWHYQFMVANQLYYGVLPTANSKTEAKDLEVEERRKVRQGPGLNTSGLDQFSRFVTDVYLKYSRENKVSWLHDEFRCEMLCEYFGSKRFNEITPMQCASFINQRLGTMVKRHRQVAPASRMRSPVTVHKEVSLLSSIFKMAIGENVATVNPVSGIPPAVRKKLKARNKRRCNLDAQKEARLIENGLVGRNARLRPIVLFDLHTGLRLGELCRLERDHVNLEQQAKWFEISGDSIEVPTDCIIVAQSKNGKPRVVPLNSIAKSVVVHQLSDVTIGKYIFPSPKADKMLKEVKKGFASGCTAAGLKYGQYARDGITFHTLRHWFNSKLEERGVNKTVRRDLLGHQPKDITDDYTHSTVEQRRKALELLCHNDEANVVQFDSSVATSVAAA